jgi:hypothetical protein
MELDLWCRNRVSGSDLRPDEVADRAVVARRQPKRVGMQRLPLHDYVPLYFNARNAMLYSLKPAWNQLIVLDIEDGVLDLPGVRVTPRNAAVGEQVHDRAVADGLPHLDAEVLYSRTWKRLDGDQEIHAKRAMQAEVLVPKRVPSSLIIRGRVASSGALEAASATSSGLELVVDEDLFFGAGA